MSELPISEGSTQHTDDFIRVATLEELKTAGMVVVRGACCPLLVVHDGDKVFALDNRCPHLGFPLHRGSVEDGILTCHWHHARFDLASGVTCTGISQCPSVQVASREGLPLSKP
jgi:nitrite reductase/ring-hydroxylating ferredoxin subunit